MIFFRFNFLQEMLMHGQMMNLKKDNDTEENVSL